MIIKRLLTFLLFLVIILSATAQNRMKLESLDGPVTANEMMLFTDFVKSLTNLQPENINNDYVYGNTGSNTEAIGIAYQINNDIELLNVMIKFADHMLQARNNPTTGRILWTGNRELCWPNKNPAALTADSVYSGTENGDVIAHIAFCAKLIIETKNCWNKKVPGGDPYQFGSTYMERARTYIRECNKTLDSFIIPHFVKKDTYEFIFPESEKYGFDERSKKSIGKPVPWNQQVMLAGGFQRLAECMELLNEEPERVKFYDKLVGVSIDAFLKSLTLYQKEGIDCYKWSYHVIDPTLKYVEDLGHSAYDMLGLFRAYQRNKYNIKKETLQIFANTLQHVMYKEDKSFAGHVDGKDGKRAKYFVNQGWILLSVVSPEMYTLVANAGMRPAQSNANMMASILWVKDQRYKLKIK